MDNSKVMIRIILQWLIAVAIVFLGLNLKGLFFYLGHQTEYTVTYRLCDYFKYLVSIADIRVNFFAAIIAILSTFISIAIPLSINQVASSLKDYKDEAVKKMFFKEPVFIQMLAVLIFLLLSLMIWYVCAETFIVGPLLLSFAILSLYYFALFFFKVIKYITAPDDVVHKHFHNIIINLFDFE